jgi:hypothetical protein
MISRTLEIWFASTVLLVGAGTIWCAWLLITR